MLAELDDYSWKEAFAASGEPDTYGNIDTNIEGCNPSGTYDLSPFTREDVATICKIQEGENDESDWIIYGQLKDGRWFSIESGCDYTGWDCRAWGSADVGNSQEEIERFGLSDSARERFGIVLQ